MAEAEAAVRAADFFRAIGWPVAARAAIWAGDIEAARRIRDALDDAALRGTAIDHDRLAARAGVAALEGRTSEAVGLYRDALKGFKAQGLAFDTALVALDAAVVLAPADRATPDLAAAIEAARATFASLGARPFAGRLEEALAAEATPTVGRRDSATEPATIA